MAMIAFHQSKDPPRPLKRPTLPLRGRVISNICTRRRTASLSRPTKKRKAMISRRQVLQSVSAGFGYLAFAGISSTASAEDQGEYESAWRPRRPIFNARAKRVIFLCMQGGPSHVDTFDYKPQLTKDHGKRGKYGGSLLKSPWEFRQRGDSGLWISDIFPNVADHADELTLIRSMQCDQPVHPGAMTQMHTGTAQFIRPSLGAWTLYGLGTENDSLPGFVSLSPPSGSSRNYGSSFLPAIYGGSKVGRGGRSCSLCSRWRRGECAGYQKSQTLRDAAA